MSLDESYRKTRTRKHLSDAFSLQRGLKQGENKEMVYCNCFKIALE
jgi:hypothetical protein